MEIKRDDHYPLWLLMKLAYEHNRKGEYESLRGFPRFGSSDNKYHNRVECNIYVPKRFSLGDICQYVFTATIAEDGSIKCEPWTKEKLEKGGYAVLDDLESWHEIGLKFVDKVNDFLGFKYTESTEPHSEAEAV